ncbi:helix-turn-helix domain-containing protein [Burkholderia cenocepacia]|uniref:helix-turn-helix domain-containing protein n=1 Tax=Burkholderia cenocepacia TaxID=95486 RepID=UPI0015894466|nr:helix-turn-helix transcriptional regulator [Burkholderia cenocepacia]
MSRQLQLRHIVGQRIRSMRKSAGLSQEKAAVLLDLSTEGYAKYERGESSPNIMFLEKLSKAFNCTIIELITETSVGLSAQAQHISNLLDGVSTSDRDEIVKILESVCAVAHKKYKKLPSQ